MRFVKTMDPTDFLEDEQLLQFLHCRKTELSVIEDPRLFLNQLNDYNLLPTDMYEKVIRTKSKAQRQKSVYEMLDWLERKRPQHIKLFWKCVFKEHLLLHYPTLRQLRSSLMDGSFTFSEELPEKVEQGIKKKTAPEDGEKMGKKKKTTRSVSLDEEKAGPSSLHTPRKRKKVQKPSFGTPLTKGQSRDIWTWELYRTQVPVTCGDKEGMLYRAKLAKGKKCIIVKNEWFTPAGFEEFGGKKSCGNWKGSIRCGDTSLDKLIQEGHLTSPGLTRDRSHSPKIKRTPRSHSKTSITESESEEEERETGESDSEHDRDGGQPQVFKVTCGIISGVLHKYRFASGTCGKSIRTEHSWMTPVEFLSEGSVASDDWRWRQDIQCDGRPLSFLIEEGSLTIHTRCACRLCSSDPEDLKEQSSDDDCFICRGVGDLVLCDTCPRSFHQDCHLPRLDNALVNSECEWVCTVCVYQTSKDWRYPEGKTLQEAHSCPVYTQLLECQYLLMYMYHADEERVFATDSCLKIEGYRRVVRTPMWLDKVKEKLQQEQYQTVQHFMMDLLLIFDNCATFNKDDRRIRDLGFKLRDCFESEFTSVFRVQQ
ncbi:nuclear body protein SP140-like protein isoform X2 [Hypomesus transpacificus]|uniref:nuclear body protein SP140-like protein isoform X2 n=1 Tax=Hypomesus transpacificus TaxID=137520 RepID=UPI001F075350|nr:nuclear body protein SP140-like protein isoform X2 [Hypomesus transpacificus]